jgi:AcrR family transcriptional regulator
VDAALRLVAAEGAALTVARVARQAGMDPSGFYAHFKNIEECESAAADAFRQAIDDRMRAYTVLRSATELPVAIEAAEALLTGWLSKPEWITLLARCRFDDSPLGKAVRELFAAVRGDFCEALWDLATRRGLRGRHLREVEAVAELCVGQFITMLERLAAGRASDVHAAAEQLARANFAVVTAAFTRMAERDAELAKHEP